MPGHARTYQRRHTDHDTPRASIEAATQIGAFASDQEAARAFLRKRRERRNQQVAATQTIHDHRQSRTRSLGSPRGERIPRERTAPPPALGRREALRRQHWRLQSQRPARSLVVARCGAGSVARGQCQEMRFDPPGVPVLRGQIQHPRMQAPPATPTHPLHRADDRTGSSARSLPHAGGSHRTLCGRPDTPLRHFLQCRWREQSRGQEVHEPPLLRAPSQRPAPLDGVESGGVRHSTRQWPQ